MVPRLPDGRGRLRHSQAEGHRGGGAHAAVRALRGLWRRRPGGGFYDRTLAALQPRPATVGLGFAHGFLPNLEPEPHDIALDAILNELGVAWPISLDE